METKICSKCKIEKELTEFNKNNRSSDWCRYECRECQKKRNKINNSFIEWDLIKCTHCWELKHFSLIKKSSHYIWWYSHICKECNLLKYFSKTHSKYNPKYKQKEFIKWIIYILECNWIYKIGKTIQNIKNRLSTLQTWNPYKINLLKEYNTDFLNYDEKNLHSIFIKKKFKNEWFNLNKEDLYFIEKYFIY